MVGFAGERARIREPGFHMPTLPEGERAAFRRNAQSQEGVDHASFVATGRLCPSVGKLFAGQVIPPERRSLGPVAHADLGVDVGDVALDRAFT